MTSLIMLFGGMGFLLFCGARRKKEWLLNIVMRGILGTVSIYFVNLFFTFIGVPVAVGINPFTVLTCTILGIPGVLGLYGLVFSQML